MTTEWRRSSILAIFTASAVAGIVLFGIMWRRATSIEQLDSSAAAARIEAIRQRFGNAEPMLRLSPEGAVIERRRWRANTK